MGLPQDGRATLDEIHRQWIRKIEENILRDHMKEEWFGLFMLAHGLDRAAGVDVAQALQKTGRAIRTVQDKLKKIFEEKLTQDDKYWLVKDYAEAYRDARAQIDETLMSLTGGHSFTPPFRRALHTNIHKPRKRSPGGNIYCQNTIQECVDPEMSLWFSHFR